MAEAFLKWLFGVIASSGLVAVLAVVMRDTVVKFFAKSIEHRFDRKLEESKGEIRDNEKELEQIRSFLAAGRRDRDSIIQAKRLEAAENLLRARHVLSQLSLLVEYMKILKADEILKDGDNPKIAEFINALIKPVEIDEKLTQLATIEQTIPRLYLSDKSVKLFEAYQSIIISAAFMMKAFVVPLPDKSRLIKPGALSKKIAELVPASQEGFESFGEGYAYYWADYLYAEVLRSLRHEVSGADDFERDTETIEHLARVSRRAQMNVRSSLRSAGLPDTLIKFDETSEVDSAVAEAVGSTGMNKA